ncbi:DUF1232 domain-containing protein [candidate division KSB1 bacterium]|nr:DUF1232 domain-containing protein [candidate division KSB1 bacterium]
MNQDQQDFYQSLRKKIRKWLDSKAGQNNKWTEYIIWAPDLFHLLVRLSLDKDVPSSEKAKLAIVIAYFISPIDLLPEAILGPVGYTDDIALAAYVLNSMINRIDPQIVERHWAGDEEALKVIRRIVEVADQMLGKGLWQKVKKYIQ